MAKSQMISRTRWIEAKHLIKFLLQIAFSSTSRQPFEIQVDKYCSN